VNKSTIILPQGPTDARQTRGWALVWPVPQTAAPGGTLQAAGACPRGPHGLQV